MSVPVLSGLLLVLIAVDVPLARLAHQSINASGGSSPVWFAVDLDSVRDDLAGVVQHALEPAHLSVWANRPT